MKLSPTAAATYRDCPKHYEFEYVARPRPHRTGGPWAHQSLGNSVHATLAEWMVLDPRERTPERALRILAARWQTEGYRDDAQVGEWFAHAADWVEAYTARPEVHTAHVVGNERNLSASYHRHPSLIVEGRADRIDQRPDGDRACLVVVDYKTGKAAPTEAEAEGSYALAVYAYATNRILGRAHGWCTRAELHHLPTGAVVAVDYDAERVYRLLDRLADIAREIERAREFPARPGPLCASCDFLDYCAEGQARAGRADGWAYLPAEAAADRRTT